MKTKEEKLLYKIANSHKKIFPQVVGSLDKNQKNKIIEILQAKLAVMDEKQHLTENSHRRRYKGRFV